MIVAGSEGSLQTVVSRPVNVREIVDEAEVRELGGKRLDSSRRVHLIEINDARQFRAMVANVGDIESQLSGEGMLDAQRPVLDVRSVEIAIHGEGVARTWVGSSAVATLNQSSDVGRIDCGGLILPS